VRLFGAVNYLPNLGLGAWVFWILNSGIGEETGWRGFALPRLQRNRSALSATLILAVVWVIWHVPFFFYLPNYMLLGAAMFPFFAIGIVAGAIILTWLYNSTGGSILMVTLWHGALNFVTASEAGTGTVAAVVSILIIIWGVAVAIIFKPTKLSTKEKHVV